MTTPANELKALIKEIERSIDYENVSRVWNRRLREWVMQLTELVVRLEKQDNPPS